MAIGILQHMSYILHLRNDLGVDFRGPAQMWNWGSLEEMSRRYLPEGSAGCRLRFSYLVSWKGNATLPSNQRRAAVVQDYEIASEHRTEKSRG